VIDRWFRAHPRSVGESYGQHFRTASGFGVVMVGAGLAALVHAVFPALFERTGSRAIKRLHDRLAARQPDPRLRQSQPGAWHDPEWQIEYEI